MQQRTSKTRLFAIGAILAPICFLTIVSCGHGSKAKDYQIEEVIVSDFNMGGDLFWFNVDTRHNFILPSGENEHLNREWAIVYQLKERDGNPIWGCHIDGDGKRSISFPFHYITDNGGMLFLDVTLIAFGQIIDKKTKPIIIDLEKLSTPDLTD